MVAPKRNTSEFAAISLIQRGLGSRLLPYVVGSVAFGMGTYIIAGLLSPLANGLGATQGGVGVGVTAFTVAYAVIGPFIAGVGGRHARRTLTVALVVYVLATLFAALAWGLVPFLLARAAAGGAAGVYIPLAVTVAAHMVEPERRGRAVAVVVAGMSCGAAFGVPFGLFVADRTSWRIAMAVVGLIGCLSLGMLILRRESLPRIEASTRRESLRALGTGRNMLTMLVTFMTALGSTGLYTYIVPLMSAMGMYGTQQSVIVWMWGLGGAIGSLLIGRVIDAVNRSLLVTLAILVGLVGCFATFGVRPGAGVLVGTTLLWGILAWSSLTPQQHTLLTMTNRDGATTVAVNASVNYLGVAAGSATGAALLHWGLAGTQLALAAILPILVGIGLQTWRILLTRSTR